MTEIVNSTDSSPVYRGDGKRMYGLDAEIEEKRQDMRDPQNEKEILEWIEKVTGEDLYKNGNPINALKSGVILCQLVNKIKPGTIKKINTQNIAIAETGNLDSFIFGCKKLGVESSALILVHDLYSEKDIRQVFVCLNALARTTYNHSSFSGPHFGPPPKKVKKAKKWKTQEKKPLLGGKNQKSESCCRCCTIL